MDPQFSFDNFSDDIKISASRNKFNLSILKLKHNRFLFLKVNFVLNKRNLSRLVVYNNWL